MITVSYDGKCGLCLKEINHYRKTAPDRIFDWQDITQSADDLKKEGISLSEGLKLLRAKDEKGLMHVGVDAFILICKPLKLDRFFSSFVGLPIIRQIANIFYRSFAN
jgi:predicted DCC family thiol-disulfide oxidoreductase YuxK